MAERSSRCDPDTHADTNAYRRRRGLTRRRLLTPLRGRGLTLWEFFVPNQEATIAQVKSAIAEQMEAVTARLKEHDLQIQKVSVGSTTYLDESTGVFENRFNHE